ncbi:hypothetical protein [Curtobacterium sp. MCBD17_040]|uniref:hypothetical protein n=1 Tax=Curtobacterium sp. MCBD17_040 TaxID=2175674 RepID=UPI000DA7F058|nr:hypothetical protein [Curtobacterium sp. MCBD17_040]WIB65676.1 hypothetical protein DEI94_16275 [Curtobacterium sp. MCBD17_040]
MPALTAPTISKRIELLTALNEVTPAADLTVVYRGLELRVVCEGRSRTVTFPDADTDFGVLTYSDRFHTVLDVVRNLEFLAAAWADRDAA